MLALLLALPVMASPPLPPAPMPAVPVGAERAAEPATPADAAPPEVAVVPGDEPVSIEEIRRFVAVFRAVKQAYVDPVDDATLMRAAIRGLLTDLDPHSAYLDAEQTRSLTEQTSGAYDGLGIEVVQQPDRSLLVIAPIDDTPAARAGILPGDLIVAIDGKPIDAGNVEEAVDSMRGAPGSAIELTILRESAPEPLTLSLVRETIRVASVRVRALEPGYGYLRISHFQADTAADVRRKLGTLLENGALRGLVLDLRSNPGGLLHSAVDTADVFLGPGVVVSTRGRMPFAVSELRSAEGDLLADAPIVVLIDGGTASAAEVLAAALRDQRRALLLGSRSFGKGSVQTVLPLDNGDAIKLTTARYYTPSGGSIQAAGITPDVELPEGEVLRETGDRPPSLRERDLPGHLQSEAEAADDADDAVTLPTTTLITNLTADAAPDDQAGDFAVRQALTVLKGLALFGRTPAAPAQPAAKGDGP